LNRQEEGAFRWAAATLLVGVAHGAAALAATFLSIHTGAFSTDQVRPYVCI